MRKPIHHAPPNRKLSHEGIRVDKSVPVIKVTDIAGDTRVAVITKGTLTRPEVTVYEKPINKPQTPIPCDNASDPVLDTLQKILAKLTAIEGIVRKSD